MCKILNIIDASHKTSIFASSYIIDFFYWIISPYNFCIYTINSLLPAYFVAIILNLVMIHWLFSFIRKSPFNKQQILRFLVCTKFPATCPQSLRYFMSLADLRICISISILLTESIPDTDWVTKNHRLDRPEMGSISKYYWSKK